jgi:AraC-like DNA-binding protein
MHVAPSRDSSSLVRSRAHFEELVPDASTSCAVAVLSVHTLDRDTPAVAIPRAETQLVVRCGPSVRGGLEVHAVGGRQQVHRKLIGAGHWSVTARLRLGTPQAVLGVPASALTGAIVALEELWGDAAARRVRDRLSRAKEPSDAAEALGSAIAEHLASQQTRSAPQQLALEAAQRLTTNNVRAVAEHLGVSDRHLRRVFLEAVGVSPKAFAKLARFRRAVRVARESMHLNWASIASLTDYYDQAHLIAEFRAIAGVTPRAFLDELRETSSLVTP